MSCCPQNIFNFVNASVTTIPFTSPNAVEVLYLLDGVWTQAGVFTQIIKTPTLVSVDHGGVATGIIKIT